jgi:hypothetical protein
MERLSIEEQYKEAIKEMRALPNRDFKSTLDDLSRVANAQIDTYYSDNPCTCREGCKEEVFRGFNSTMAKYLVRCAAAVGIQAGRTEANFYLETAKLFESRGLNL